MNECTGCTSLAIGLNECSHTLHGIKSFKDCPCKACLVKPACTRKCEDLVNFAFANPDYIYYTKMQEMKHGK